MAAVKEGVHVLSTLTSTECTQPLSDDQRHPKPAEKEVDEAIPPEYPKSGVPILAHKLWIGNIDKRITQEQLLRILRKHGKIRSFRYLFRTSGRNAREPRGYAFVEYHTRKDCESALSSLSGKMALGQRLTVDWAKADVAAAKTEGKSQTWDPNAASKTLKSGTSVEDKIKALEMKLNSMKQQNTAKKSLSKSLRYKPYCVKH